MFEAWERVGAEFSYEDLETIIMFNPNVRNSLFRQPPPRLHGFYILTIATAVPRTAEPSSKMEPNTLVTPRMSGNSLK